jgi:hypothetical protein
MRQAPAAAGSTIAARSPMVGAGRPSSASGAKPRTRAEIGKRPGPVRLEGCADAVRQHCAARMGMTESLDRSGL